MLSNWIDRLEANKPDSNAMWAYIGVSIAVIIAILGRSLFQVCDMFQLLSEDACRAQLRSCTYMRMCYTFMLVIST